MEMTGPIQSVMRFRYFAKNLILSSGCDPVVSSFLKPSLIPSVAQISMIDSLLL
jgi:hypothetical protein